jgi:cellulose synthase/poly-beta-1,6-N-acetylglucosamine synthase-like glycosyltransferase
MAVLFWSSLGALLYVYFGYPVLIWIIWRFGNKHSSPNAAHFQTQKATVLVPAFNEAKAISGKMHNCLGLVYPAELLDITAISDASNDRTTEIVSTYTAAYPNRVRLLRMPTGGGKTAGINAAMRLVNSEVIVFTDADVTLHSDAINAVIAALSDEGVSGVAGPTCQHSNRQC